MDTGPTSRETPALDPAFPSSDIPRLMIFVAPASIPCAAVLLEHLDGARVALFTVCAALLVPLVADGHAGAPKYAAELLLLAGTVVALVPLLQTRKSRSHPKAGAAEGKWENYPTNFTRDARQIRATP